MRKRRRPPDILQFPPDAKYKDKTLLISCDSVVLGPDRVLFYQEPKSAQFEGDIH